MWWNSVSIKIIQNHYRSLEKNNKNINKDWKLTKKTTIFKKDSIQRIDSLEKTAKTYYQK